MDVKVNKSELVSFCEVQSIVLKVYSHVQYIDQGVIYIIFLTTKNSLTYFDSKAIQRPKLLTCLPEYQSL